MSRKRTRWWGWRSRRALSITRMGRTYIVLTIGIGFGALNTGNNLLYLVLGLLLSTIVVSGVMSERVLRGVSVRRLGTEAAFAGEPFPFRYAVSRSLPGASFALSIAEDSEELEGGALLACVAHGEEVVARGQLLASRRGPHRLERIKLTTTFPLGLFAKSALIEAEDLLLVYPRRGYACENAPEAELGPAGEAGNPQRHDGNGDLAGLRELQEGEDARRVHWTKSAAAGRLLLTLREREERRSYVLQVRPSGSPQALERRLEEVSALARRLLADGNEVGLEAPKQRLRPAGGAGQQRRILRALAWVGYEEKP